ISSLRSTFTFNDFKSDILALFQCLKSFFLDSRVMYEYIVSFFYMDETIAFFSVEPFYYSFLHVNILLYSFTIIRANTKKATYIKKRISRRMSHHDVPSLGSYFINDSIPLLCYLQYNFFFHHRQEVRYIKYDFSDIIFIIGERF